MSDDKASPRPWIVNDMADVKGADGSLVTSLGWDISPENEAYFRRAVNAHDALVHALWLYFRAHDCTGVPEACPLCGPALKALALAESA